LTHLDHEELKRQLKDSYDTLTRLGESFYAFSYPWGQWSSLIAGVVKDSGYECALAVGEQTRLTAANIHFLPRITMRSDLNLRRFRALLTRTTLGMEMRRKYAAVLRIRQSCLKRP